MELLRDAESTQQLSRVTLRIPPLHKGKLLLQLCRTDAVSVREVLLSVECVLLLLHRPEGTMSLHDGIEHRLIVKGEVILR